MKTMKKNKEVIRVSEDKINEMLDKGYTFCPKSEYKKLNNDTNDKEQE